MPIIVSRGTGDKIFPRLNGNVKLIDGATPPNVVAGVGTSVLVINPEFIRPKKIRSNPRIKAKKLLNDLGISSRKRFFLKNIVTITNKSEPINADTRTYSS